MLSLLNEKDFDRMYEIMEQSFPTDEYRPYDEQKALFDNKEYKVYTWKNDDRVVAFMALWDFKDVVFIEHFAVDSNYRNGGIGAKMLSGISSLFNKTLCLEVEPPDTEITRRRIGFYERNNFYLNTYPYMQPSISNGRKSIPLMIMTSKREVSKDEFIIIKDLLYREVYKVY